MNAFPIDQSSRRKEARTAGWLYLLMAIFGFFSMMVVAPKFYVRGDAAATAGRILASETLFRLGFVSNLVSQIVFLFLAYALYRLFRSVDKNQARLMVILVVASVPVTFLNMINQFAPLLLLKGTPYLSTFTPEQLQTLAMMFFNLHQYGILLAGIFWGLWLFPLGILAFKSGFIPRVFGVLLLLGCFGYVVDSLAFFLFPDYRALLAPIVTVSELIGELPFLLWLLIKGVTNREPVSAKAY